MENIKIITPDINDGEVKIEAFVLPNLNGSLSCQNCNYYIPRFFPKYLNFKFEEGYLKRYKWYVQEGFLNAFRLYIDNLAGDDILNNPIDNANFTTATVTIPDTKIDNLSVKNIIIITQIGRSLLSEMVFNSIKFAADQGYSSVAFPFVKWEGINQDKVFQEITRGIDKFQSTHKSNIEIYVLLRAKQI